MIATAMTATGMTGTVMIAMSVHTAMINPTAVNVRARLLAAATWTIVAPGPLHLEGILMIGGLQGTMIYEEGMMTDEALTLIMIAAGMTGAATRMTTGSTIECLRGMRTGMAGGAERDRPGTCANE